MTSAQFEQILETATNRITDKLQNKQKCNDSKEFETMVLKELQMLCRDKKANAVPAFHQHAFPDIIVNGFGVEVKHTIKDSWLAVGNSIFESMRDNSAQLIYLVYGKMGGWPEVRWARYEDCITHVRISHAPRFVIEMENPAPFFKNVGLSYEKFAVLSPEKKMGRVREYARGRLRTGEKLWWLEDREEQEHTLPIGVKIFRHLPDDEKRKLRAEATLLCPEILQGGHARGKYDQAGLYLITRHGVFAPQLRDLFSAGSVGARGGKRGHKYIIEATRDIEHEMIQAAKDLDDALFVEYWDQQCPPNKRIATWLKLADKYATDWKPSAELFIGSI